MYLSNSKTPFRISLLTVTAPLLVSCDIGSGEGNEIPYMGTASYYYTSTSEDQITINFRVPGGVNGRPPFDAQDTVIFPRAYVYYVDGYSRSRAFSSPISGKSKTYSSLPSTVFTMNNIGLLISSPDGMPFMLTGKSSDIVDPPGSATKRDKPTSDVIILDLRNVPSHAARQALLTSRSKLISRSLSAGGVIEKNGEYNQLRTPDKWEVIYKDVPDNDLAYITCVKTNYKYRMCSYYIFLSDRYYGVAQFVDFRIWGDERLLKTRISAVRKAVCARIRCN